MNNERLINLFKSNVKILKSFYVLFIIIHYKDLAGFNLLTQSTKHDSLNHRQSKTFFLPS